MTKENKDGNIVISLSEVDILDALPRDVRKHLAKCEKCRLKAQIWLRTP